MASALATITMAPNCLNLSDASLASISPLCLMAEGLLLARWTLLLLLSTLPGPGRPGGLSSSCRPPLLPL